MTAYLFMPDRQQNAIMRPIAILLLSATLTACATWYYEPAYNFDTMKRANGYDGTSDEAYYDYAFAICHAYSQRTHVWYNQYGGGSYLAVDATLMKACLLQYGISAEQRYTAPE